MMLTKRADTPLEFDFAKVVEASKDNPVFYVQYAHARISSVLRQAGQFGVSKQQIEEAPLDPLTSSYESALLRLLADYPVSIEAAARDLAPHIIAFYLKELAAAFHSYYNAEHFLVEEPALRNARLSLVAATGRVLRNGLALLGVNAPEQM
jgi:arginyl-tRNA synthetase